MRKVNEEFAAKVSLVSRQAFNIAVEDFEGIVKVFVSGRKQFPTTVLYFSNSRKTSDYYG